MRRDIANQKYGRLTALEYSHTVKSASGKSRRTYWVFQCECGNIKVLRMDGVVSGKIKSCGCLKKEQDEINLNRKGSKPTKYNSEGLSNHPLYHKWLGIKRRCYNKNDSSYDNYGGRGITMCDEWLYDFKSFFDWSINNGWEEGLQIDRIDNDGNYEPSNCRFVDIKTNCNNRRTTIKITFNGITKSATEWAEDLNVNPKDIYYLHNRKGIPYEHIIEILHANTEVIN